MNSDIYDHLDYKLYILSLIEGAPDGSRGVRKSLAISIGCQVSHITNVLTGSAHFTPEQGEAVGRFFGLDAYEIEFLLQLIQYARAGTVQLKQRCLMILKKQREEFLELKNRLKLKDSLQSEDQARYYSCWQMGATHMLLSLPSFQTRDAIAKRLGLSQNRADEILATLVELGICQKTGQRYSLLEGSLHLDRNSPFIIQHHTNWRMCALRSFDSMANEDLHYSGSLAISKLDFLKIREILTKALSEGIEVAKESKEEDLAAICIDFFMI